MKGKEGGEHASLNSNILCLGIVNTAFEWWCNLAKSLILLRKRAEAMLTECFVGDSAFFGIDKTCAVLKLKRTFCLGPGPFI
jgi:hypothetical protein